MFERFTAQLRQAIQLARSEAHVRGSDQIGCEDLLAGLAHGRTGLAADALSAAGLSPARLRALTPRQPAAEPLDADALALLGIDLDQVKRAAEAAFGPGALDCSSRRRPSGKARMRMAGPARMALELALRTAQAQHAPAVSAGHLLIGIIDQGDNGALRLLAAADVDPAALRADLLRRMAAAA